MACFHVRGYNRRGGHVSGYKRCVRGSGKHKRVHHRRHRKKR